MTRVRPRSIRLALVAAGLFFVHALAPVQADPVPVAERGAALSSTAAVCEVADPVSMRPSLGACERALAACMNAGGNSDTCWNAYWRCTG